MGWLGPSRWDRKHALLWILFYNDKGFLNHIKSDFVKSVAALSYSYFQMCRLFFKKQAGPQKWYIELILTLDRNETDIPMETELNVVQSLYCPACRTSLIATKFWVVMICPIIKSLTVLEFSFILFDLCLFITIFNFILNHVPIVTFWILTYHKIWILLIIFCFIWSYWIIYFLTCLEVFWSVVS